MQRTSKRRGRSGVALVYSVVAVMVVSILAAGFMQLALSVTRRLSSTSDTAQALNIAEAGLAEAYTGLAVARTGNVGSREDPAFFGGGCFWVEAEEQAGGMVELKCTALYGTGRATLELACEPVSTSVSSLGFFTSESLRMNPDVRLDSYDSALGTYASQINTSINNKGKVGTNADVSIASGNFIFGDVVYGPTGKLDVASGAVITGGTMPRPELEVLPPVEVPEVTLGKAVKYTSGTPLVIAPGTTGYAELDIGKNSKLILKGPLTLVVGSLALRLGSQMVFDTTDGPVELYVTETLDMSSSSVVSTTTQRTGDSLIFVSAPPGKTVSFGAKSQFYGFIYAPNSDVHISAQYELYGGFVARNLQLAAQGKMHYDLSLGTTQLAQLPLLHSWRVVELPQELVVARIDPFHVLGLDPSALRSPGECHEDQVLDIRYLTNGGRTDSYFGRESDFDWSLVKELLYGARDGRAFFLPPDYATTTTVADDPLVDLVASDMTSKELRDALLAASPVSGESLVAACEREPPMNTSDLKSVLDANTPLKDPTLLAAVGSAALDSSALKGVLLTNSPLSSEVLDAVLKRSPPLSGSDLTNVLAAQ
jgi:type II secretory pathway pseudopilin PulG